MNKPWYISGALLGGAPLAQGTVYLMLKRTTAHLLTAALVLYVVVASVCVVRAPVDSTAVEPDRLTERVFAWAWVRLFSPVVNPQPTPARRRQPARTRTPVPPAVMTS